MTPELDKYYQERFAMTGSQGWKDLIADVKDMLVSTNTLNGVDTESQLQYRKGEISIMNWLISLESMSEQAYQQLKEENA